MSEYRYPLNDILFSLNEIAGLARLNAHREEEVDQDLVEAILSEAGKLSEQCIAPLNHTGDQEGSRVVNGDVQEAKGFKEAFKEYVEGGWSSLAGSEEFGGQGLPFSLAAAVNEGVMSANLAFSLCPLLSQGSIEAIETHGSQALKDKFLPNMVSGEWTGTMNLTEPNAGSDLAAIAAKATPNGDHFLVSGQKIFITWGDHQMTDNVIHLVLARLPDAPAGVKGISLFLVPKYLVKDDGSLGERNDVTVVSVEKKLGIHASPTCVMSFGENQGAIGYLVGQEHQGIMAMFTMMNNARQGVGLQGLAIAERAYQQALDYAKDRVQGMSADRSKRAPIIEHPDVLRMLMTMKSQIDAMRSLVLSAAVEIDLANATQGPEQRSHKERVNMYTPIVKGWITEQAQEITSLAIQVHGGVGFIEETGVAQHARDARILPIYEGTNGIQALDLIGRKMYSDKGLGFSNWVEDLTAEVQVAKSLGIKGTDLVLNALSDLTLSKQACLAQMNDDAVLGTGSAYALMMQTGYVVGACLQIKALAKLPDSNLSDEQKASWHQSVEFYIQQILPRATAQHQTIMTGLASVSTLSAASFER
ncbi:probable acyl-CoA dehydrogenase [Marinomonas sp. MED121]|uniref:acyl-CoA dehydrogenase n=1 Tax=Marinomonas sp. MED121 TaxID=314277 RepID=UPI0000690160|nr:acyl-CoA dehydrogenase family protein [Marinomonas sp. MED121]EAQ63298.1 probable acyl-CoA dehydrogenase [Marinomonas sp. MED121]